jgi:S-adenosylmethionine:tRNA ribosyltransferase-isomerase
VTDLPAWLRAADALVLNETRVRPARLAVRRRPTGGRMELLFVRPESGAPGEPGGWRVLVRPARLARPGTLLDHPGDDLELEVLREGDEGERVVRVVRGDLAATLARAGQVPLPPYIRHAPGPEDGERYQTVYARVEGAVAAPTAGLHFSEGLLQAVEARGVRLARVLLHVGPGTFRPITAPDPRAHRMDEEYFEVTAEAAEALRKTRAAGGRIVPVGTTAVRALESACDEHGGAIGPASGWTRKYILPPYRFQAADMLLTNFHLPRTTLLLLVAAFAGEDLVRDAYRHAVDRRYRFYSYGDAMLVV